MSPSSLPSLLLAPGPAAWPATGLSAEAPLPATVSRQPDEGSGRHFSCSPLLQWASTELQSHQSCSGVGCGGLKGPGPLLAPGIFPQPLPAAPQTHCTEPEVQAHLQPAAGMGALQVQHPHLRTSEGPGF